VAADALADALAVAREMTLRSADALAAIKQVSRASSDLEIESALTVEQRVVNKRMASSEMAALMREMNELGLDIRDVRAQKTGEQ
jgi:enoyl-CoA hydratase/carnithine racemase